MRAEKDIIYVGLYKIGSDVADAMYGKSSFAKVFYRNCPVQHFPLLHVLRVE